MGQDEAVAVAISSCQEKAGDITLSKEDYREFFAIAERKEHDAADAVSLDASRESEVNFPNPQIDLQKAQLAMSGSAVNLLREIKAELRMLNAKSDHTPKPEGEDIETPSDDSGKEDAKQLDRRQKIFDAFQKRLDRLTSKGDTNV